MTLLSTWKLKIECYIPHWEKDICTYRVNECSKIRCSTWQVRTL